MDTGVISRVLPLLLQAGCLGDNRALYLSSVLYSSGVGVKTRPMRVCEHTLSGSHFLSLCPVTCDSALSFEDTRKRYRENMQNINN